MIGPSVKAPIHFEAAAAPKKMPDKRKRSETRKYNVPMTKKSTYVSGVPIRPWARARPSMVRNAAEASAATSLLNRRFARRYMKKTEPTLATAPKKRQPTGL